MLHILHIQTQEMCAAIRLKVLQCECATCFVTVRRLKSDAHVMVMICTLATRSVRVTPDSGRRVAVIAGAFPDRLGPRPPISL
jgi:hypothetical protein